MEGEAMRRSGPAGSHGPDAMSGWGWVAWLVLAAAVLLLGGSIAQKAYRLSLPTDGWTFTIGDVGTPDQDRPIYSDNLLAKPSPLHAGDKLLAIEGRSYDKLLTRDRTIGASPIPQWRAGSAVRYTVLRHGRRLTLSVPLYHWSPWAALLAVLTNLSMLGSIPLACVGWFVFLRRPSVWASRPLLIFSISLLATNISSTTVDWGPPELASPLVIPVYVFFSNLIFVMVLLPSLLLITLTCPRPRGPLRRHPFAVTAALYGLSPVLLLLVGLNAPVLWLTTLTMAVVSVVLVITSVVRERSPVERAQARWALLGVATVGVGLVVVIVSGFGVLGTWPVWLTTLWFPFILTAMAICFAVAILRYRLFDIDILINRALVYGSLTISLGLFYLGGVVSLEALFRSVAGPSSDLAVAISTLAIAALFHPLRRRIQAFIDRRFYRRKYDATRTLATFQTRLKDEVNLDDLTGDLVGVVQDTMQPAHVSLWLREARTKS